MELTSKLSVTGTLTKGKVAAHDKYSRKPDNRARNLSFFSNIYETALELSYSFLDLKDVRLSPYVSAGICVFRFNPMEADIGELRPLSTEGQGFTDGRNPYKLIGTGIPFAVGIRFRVSDGVLLGYSVGIRKTFTDYIDDVSTTYVDEQLLRQNRGDAAVRYAFRGDEIDPAIAYPAAGSLRGSPKSKDWYYFSGLTLSFAITNPEGKLFGKNPGKGSVDCPKW